MPYTQEELKKELKRLTNASFLQMLFDINPCIKTLLPIINRDDDKINLAAFHLISNFGIGNLFLTDKRLIFLETGAILKNNYELYFSNIASYERSQGFNKLFAVEIVDNGGKKFIFKNLKEQPAAMIISYCQNIKEKQTTPAQTITSLSEADELKKFADLLAQGVITQDEFDNKKKQILGI